MTLEIKEVKPLSVRTISSMPTKSAAPKAPATLVEIKAAMIISIRAAARKIDQALKGRQRKTSHTWLAVRTDSKRHVLKFVVSGGDDYLFYARDLAKQVEQWIADRFDQQVPIEVSEAPCYEVRSTGNSVSIYRGQAVPSKIDQEHEFF